MTTSFYIQGTTVLHRLPAGLKCGVLFAAGIGLFVIPSVVLAAAATIAAVVLVVLVRVPVSVVRTRLAPIAIMMLIFAAVTAVLQGPPAAILMLLRLTALVLLAFAVTTSTSPTELLEFFERITAPLARIGVVNPSHISLGMSLVLRFVPEMFHRFQEIRQAQWARGVKANPVALLVPLLVRTLKSAHDVGVAIDARCYPDGGGSQRSSTGDIALVALFAALIAAFGWLPPITVGVGPVPVTLQTLGVMLAGALLGPWRGFLACALVELLAALGLPLLSGGRGGLAVFAGPTAGYLLGWMLGAVLIGVGVKYWALRCRSRKARIAAFFVVCAAGGVIGINLPGIVWVSISTGLSLSASAVAGLVFLPGHLLKAAVAAVVADGVLRVYPQLIHSPRVHSPQDHRASRLPASAPDSLSVSRL